MIIHVVFYTGTFCAESLVFAFLVQLAFTCLVYPALILAYMGQAAYLSKHHDFYSSSQVGFYIAVPGMYHHAQNLIYYLNVRRNLSCAYSVIRLEGILDSFDK
jgi:hypothetical protein